MKPVDHVTPTLPSNWVRRAEDKRRQPGQKQPRKPDEEHRQPPAQDPDGRTHIIDDLA